MVFIATESTLTSQLFSHLVTKHRTVKYVIAQYNISDILLARDWPKAPARSGEYPSDIFGFHPRDFCRDDGCYPPCWCPNKCAQNCA